MNLESVKAARSKLLASLQPVGLEELPLAQAQGRVLAEDFLAPIAFPLFATSSMDGFALKAADIQSAGESSPVELKVIGDIPAGTYTEKEVPAGTTMRIMTGAPLPPGTDTVLPVELTDIQERGPDFPLPATMKAFKALKPGKHVRPVGQDFQPGDQLLEQGSHLRPQEIALLAMNGAERVAAHKLVRVALFSSGDELRQPGQTLGPGQIYESNSFSISAQASQLGAEIVQLPIAPDDLQAIIAILDQAAEAQPDLILSSAGVSVGSHDYVRDAIESNGELALWRVNMRPGKPLAFGHYRGIPLIALPGNPVSSFVSFEVFAKPAIQKMSGLASQPRLKLWARLAEEVDSDGRESYLRGRYSAEKSKFQVELTGHQGSGNLFSLVQANCLLRIPAGKKKLKAGAKVEAWLI